MFPSTLWSISLPPGYEPKGSLFSVEVNSYFDKNWTLQTLEVPAVSASILPSSNFGQVTLDVYLDIGVNHFSLGLYEGIGATVYPFGKILSFNANVLIGFGYPFIGLLLKAGSEIDIPLFANDNNNSINIFIGSDYYYRPYYDFKEKSSNSLSGFSFKIGVRLIAL